LVVLTHDDRKERPLSRKVHISSKAIYAYTLCGWHTHSDIPLTRVPTSALESENASIRIQIAPGVSPVAKCVDSSDCTVFQHSLERSFFKVGDIGDFEVTRGERIVVWPATGATKKDIEFVLFGPVWATLCHQRGILPLHSSAIETGQGIAAFAGRSGAGKSTLAALMNSLGHALVTDDILPISFGQDAIPGAWPYLRRLKLQGDPIIKLALTPTECVNERWDKEKYFVGPKLVADDKWNRLQRLYLLEIDPTASSVSIEQIVGAEAVRILIDQTYHFQFILCTGRFRDHLALCSALASKIAIFRLRRPPLFDMRKDLGFLMSEHIGGAVG
jgi:energy-coupling factor transporter ATP-binding protein EcfA2